jgi:hypothetical protein
VVVRNAIILVDYIREAWRFRHLPARRNRMVSPQRIPREVTPVSLI